jgi:ribosomal protein L7/L12
MFLLLAAFAIVAVFVIASRLRGGPAPGSAAPASPEEVKRLIDAGEFVEALKQYRQLTGLGLYEAKQAVDRMRISGAWEAPAASAPVAGDDDVAALVRENKLIEAIKLYQSKHGVDLTTAKQAVDKLAFGP